MKLTVVALTLFLANLSAVTAQMNNVYCNAAPWSVRNPFPSLRRKPMYQSP
jgi:hypothetical protein